MVAEGLDDEDDVSLLVAVIEAVSDMVGVMEPVDDELPVLDEVPEFVGVREPVDDEVALELNV